MAAADSRRRASCTTFLMMHGRPSSAGTFFSLFSAGTPQAMHTPCTTCRAQIMAFCGWCGVWCVDMMGWLKRFRWLVRESSESSQREKSDPAKKVPLQTGLFWVGKIRWQHKNFVAARKTPGKSAARTKTRRRGSSYLLELLDGTLVDTAALVDQVCAKCELLHGVLRWIEREWDGLRPVVVDLPESTWPMTTTLI